MLRENAPSDTVENFGVSGLTVRKDDQASYWKGYRFAPAIEFAADTVIIELGTNDSKSYTTWNTPAQDAAVDSAITADFEALIDTFQVKSKPHVFICLAPYVNNVEWNILDTAVVKRVNPAILQAGLEKGVNVIDLHSRFSALENPSWYLEDIALGRNCVCPFANGYVACNAGWLDAQGSEGLWLSVVQGRKTA